MREGEPRLLLESAFLGVVGALGAQLFMLLLRACNHIFLYKLAGYVPPGIEGGSALRQTVGPHGLWIVPAVTTIGGLLSGILVYRFAPEAEGHGTDTAVDAFHRKEGLIRARVAPIKMLASAITIGSGGAAGREGPIALIAAGLGSVYARLAHRSEEERRLLLLAGMAAGLSAIFRSPMGTGVFAIEVLYGSMEFEVGALLYTMLSSAVAYAVNGAFVGFRPLFTVPTIPTPVFSDYAAYAILGLAAGLIATVLPQVFYYLRDFFRMLPIPIWTKPAIGGLGVGLLALRLPQVLGGGYGWIQLAINGRLTLFLLLGLIFAKMLAFALTVSSGGSGGVFAPSLFVGAMLGGSFAILLHQLPAVFVIVGMAAVFGAAARVPIATMLMVTEMAGGYHLLVPAGLAVMISYLLQVRLSSFVKYRSLYEGQVATRQDSPAHYLEQIQVALNLLGRRNLPLMDKVGHIDLLRLLRSKIRFDLPGNRQLTMGLIKEDSPLLGKTIRMLYDQLNIHDFEIVAIMRREHVLLPHPDTVLEPKDRVILIASQTAQEPLAKYIAPIPQVEEAGVQAPMSDAA
ncbi:MAG TPA: chloride channel protein [Candidatus Sulfotelmatobacter sp.]|nr:chloride channel protein [Candidatus Sulfotelmatobacter sp.]